MLIFSEEIDQTELISGNLS
jgi:hypothetical protein